MHNLLSRSQLNQWRHLETTVDTLEVENQKLDDYYECLVECDLENQTYCKRICRKILN